jgi:uncharacterized protein (TIGR03437 family)
MNTRLEFMKWLVTLIILLMFALGAFGQSGAGNTVAGMGYLYPAPVNVAPGQLITVFVAGTVQGNISATIQNQAAPVLEVRPGPACESAPCSSVTGVTIQVPYGIVTGCSVSLVVCPDVIALTQLVVTVGGVAGAAFDLNPLPDRVHMLTACDTVLPSGSGIAPDSGLPCAPLVTHADGSLVTPASPAQGGEELVAYAVGLGVTTPAVATGEAATGATPTVETFYLDFNFRPNALATLPLQLAPLPTSAFPLYAGLAPGYAGLYQINFVVLQPPAGLPACSSTVQSNLTVSVGGQTSFDGAGICVGIGEAEASRGLKPALQ